MSVYCATPATLRLETLDGTGTVTASLDLMDDSYGYRISTLDVAFPTVRADVAALATRDGDYDATSLYGPRAVTVGGWFVPSAHGSRQKALEALAWWCQPRLRPRVVYAVDADTPPRWLGLRGAQLSGPTSNAHVTQFTVSWVAPDPVARVLTPSTVTINPGASGTATNGGTYRAWPTLTVYGPCTNPTVTWVTPAAGLVVFSGLTIATGHYVTVDTNTQTCLVDGDPNQSVYQYLDFHSTRWAGLEPGATTLTFTASTSSSPARVVVSWADSTI